LHEHPFTVEFVGWVKPIVHASPEMMGFTHPTTTAAP
jgi:hypothetical protein